MRDNSLEKYKNLRQLVAEKHNDYSKLEVEYQAITGYELVSEPYSSISDNGQKITLSASIVIAAWNASSTIQKCLKAIEQSSFNQLYPTSLEVIVIDDGSSDNTWDILENTNLDLNITIIHQDHCSRAHAMNTGISVAQGDVIISCDADMILTMFSIEELIKRHQILENVLLIGFRSDINAEDIRISDISAYLPKLPSLFYGDNRVSYHWEGHSYPGWPDHMCLETDHLKALGNYKRLWMADGNKWDLPRMVYGTLFSMRRKIWFAMQGFDEMFYGWGWEDTLVGARALALGQFVIPVYSATGYHVAHPIRSPKQWEEGAINSRKYQQILHEPFIIRDNTLLNKSKKRIKKHKQLVNFKSSGNTFHTDLDRVRNKLAMERRTSDYYFYLGRYSDAINAISDQSYEDNFDHGWKLLQKGKILRYIRKNQDAIIVLKDASHSLAGKASPLIELALVQAAIGEFKLANQSLVLAKECDPHNKLLGYIMHCPAYKHIQRGNNYAAQNFHSLALRDYEAALIQNPDDEVTHRKRQECLLKLSETPMVNQG